MNLKKAIGSDGISIKVTKTASKIVDSHLTNLIKQDEELNNFLVFPKVASVIPKYKKDKKCKIKNYRPVSILNIFSKMYETCLRNCLTPFVNKVLSNFVSAYWKICNMS